MEEIKDCIIEELKARGITYHDALLVLDDVRDRLADIAKIQ